MQLSQQDYINHLANGTLRLAFVGMSNIGKSYAGRAMADAFDLRIYENDAQIAQTFGLVDMQALADWMHYPDHPHHDERAARYITEETGLIKKALKPSKGAIFDLTGSAIYCDPAVLSALKQDALIVHISASERDITRLKDLFFENPKPLIWRSAFTTSANEDSKSAMRRCYPELLESRKSAYIALADISIPSKRFRDMSGEAIAALIGRSLPTG
ncbi:nucleoside/nucleotide kinase family protein [Robiginitomaculum antarcticum]|uniref:hypothetical protein n=1 Tax=Robiginitomaculum antarcticum TaxID=437507 RepID=UPI00037C6AB1|nr:hypothetical protein [Robiginitomaculum antarcticum]